jgi:hypothetical protein
MMPAAVVAAFWLDCVGEPALPSTKLSANVVT